MSFENLKTVRQVAELNPAFSESALRWLIFNSTKNGFDDVIVKLGRRVLIDTQRLDKWVERNRVGRPS